MRVLATAAVAAPCLAALLVGITLVALESQEVVVLRTADDTGEVHETRVWIFEADGSAWLEAASPESEWYRHVLARPVFTIVRDGTAVAHRAVPQPGAQGHARIRRLFREKYGLADWWIAHLQDGSRSVMVRADPLDERGGPVNPPAGAGRRSGLAP